MLKFDGNDLRIDDKGTFVSAGEMGFTRQAGELATDELVAKRAR
jgi:hypothetical protein